MLGAGDGEATKTLSEDSTAALAEKDVLLPYHDSQPAAAATARNAYNEKISIAGRYTTTRRRGSFM